MISSRLAGHRNVNLTEDGRVINPSGAGLRSQARSWGQKVFSGAFLIRGMQVFITIMHSAPDPNKRGNQEFFGTNAKPAR